MILGLYASLHVTGGLITRLVTCSSVMPWHVTGSTPFDHVEDLYYHRVQPQTFSTPTGV